MTQPDSHSLVPISVVMPVYNGQKYLRECVSSVLSQTHRNFELLIRDDGSTDKSREILESFRDPRIRFLPGGENVGLFENLNLLIREAQGPLVHIFCQDDVMEPNCLEETVRFNAGNPEIAMSFSKCVVLDAEGREIERNRLGDMESVLSSEMSLQHLFYHGCITSNLSSVSFRRDIFQEVGGFDPSYGVSADYEMWVRLCMKHSMGVIHQHLLRLRHHEGQWSMAHTSGLPFIRHNKNIRATILPKLPQEVQSVARDFELRRHFVLDVHYGLRALLKGRLGTLFTIAGILGWGNFFTAAFAWLRTGNNHWSRPIAIFVESDSGRKPVEKAG